MRVQSHWRAVASCILTLLLQFARTCTTSYKDGIFLNLYFKLRLIIVPEKIAVQNPVIASFLEMGVQENGGSTLGTCLVIRVRRDHNIGGLKLSLCRIAIVFILKTVKEMR